MLIKLHGFKPASAVNVLQAFSDKLLGIAVPMRLGASDPNYIAPLIFERQESLTAKGNPFFEHADVLLHARQGHVETVGQLGDRGVRTPQLFQNPTPGGV